MMSAEQLLGALGDASDGDDAAILALADWVEEARVGPDPDGLAAWLRDLPVWLSEWPALAVRVASASRDRHLLRYDGSVQHCDWHLQVSPSGRLRLQMVP